MATGSSASTLRVGGGAIYPRLAPIPVACFVGALLTDVTYAKTADIMWSNFSAWLLAVGLFVACVAAAAGLVDLIGDSRVRAQRWVWPYAIGTLLVLVLALFDNLVHTHDGWTSVVPTGLTLSAIIVAVLAVTTILGWTLGYTREGERVR